MKSVAHYLMRPLDDDQSPSAEPQWFEARTLTAAVAATRERWPESSGWQLLEAYSYTCDEGSRGQK